MNQVHNDIVNKILEMANQISQQKHIANYAVMSPEVAEIFGKQFGMPPGKQFEDILI